MATMRDVIAVENRVDASCMRVVHLMANEELCADELQRYGAPASTPVDVKHEAGTWHLRATWPYRGILDVHAEGWPKFRRLVVWNLDGCGSVRDAISEAIVYFWLTFRFKPGYVFMKKLPAKVEPGQDFDGLVLLEAEWMLDRCVAVGGGY